MKSLLLALIIVSNSLLAAPLELPVNVRDDKKKISVKYLVLQDLQSNLAETEQFKILKGPEEKAIDLTSEITDEDLLKTGTVLHHLAIARNYFVNVLKSDYVSSLPQISVRIDMSKPYNENFHFLDKSKSEEFNNALTIPASGNKAMPDVSKWNIEIWFRPMKKIKVDNIVYVTGKQIDQLDVSAVLKTVADETITDAVIQSTLTESLSGLDYMGYVSQLLYTVGLFEVLPKVMMFATKSIKSESYLDTAMIPEVIYHEYSHVALSDFISVRKSTPLNEGMANYFAAVINNSSKIAAKNGSHSKNIAPYNGKAKTMYNSLLETKASGQTNFVFSFLWNLRQKLGSEFKDGELLADKIIFNSRKHVRYAEKPIKDDLLPSLMDSVGEVATPAQARKLRLIINDVAVKSGL